MNIITIGQSSEVLNALEAMSIHPINAKEGIDGIRKVAQYNPDLVIVDVELPHLDGINLIKVLNLLMMPVPVVFTAESDKSRERTAKFENFVDYILHSELPARLDASFLEKVRLFLDNFTPNTKMFETRFNRQEWANLLSKPGRKRLLVVEDDEISKSVILNILNQPNEFEIYSAKNGLEGLFMAITVNPDLILSDISMPEINGLTMCQILYILGKPFPVVFLSARNDESIITRAKNLDGVIGYIVKGEISELRDISKTISDHLIMANTLKETSTTSYQKGSLDKLAQSGSSSEAFSLEFSP